MSSASLHRKMDAGYVINLMSVDALKLSQTVRALHEVVTLPIYLAMAAGFLYYSLSSYQYSDNRWASLIGMAVMVTVVPLTTCLVAWKTKRIQALPIYTTINFTDEFRNVSVMLRVGAD